MAMLVLLYACQSVPTETYRDYFYQTRDTQEKKQFTYILYLGDDSAQNADNHKNPQYIPRRQRRADTSTKNASSKKRNKSDESEYASLAFQMEEEAYRRLDLKLASIDFCPGEVSYQVSEYTWLRYTIKGQCEQ